ncbi:AAA family ATPase [Paenibacillus sp. M1]|uniref:AAA family ATPase n=1 Tax=Paenibacillus haidiansis TaxID=1574488 RepID=A0ABU7VNL5_9BACL
MKLVILFGPQAVGKMTVGQSLAEMTDLKLFHNHMSIDFVGQFFDYGSPSGKRLVHLIRREIFEEVLKSDLEGLIFTYVWGFDLQDDWDYIKWLKELFESRGGNVYFVELETVYEERLKRNKTENRLFYKPSKRDTAKSEQDLIATYKNHRLNSYPGEITEKHYIKINNTDLGPDTVAQMIKDHFSI